MSEPLRENTSVITLSNWAEFYKLFVNMSGESKFSYNPQLTNWANIAATLGQGCGTSARASCSGPDRGPHSVGGQGLARSEVCLELAARHARFSAWGFESPHKEAAFLGAPREATATAAAYALAAAGDVFSGRSTAAWPWGSFPSLLDEKAFLQ